eukprot:6174573-Pleurochrysis_carterae.AAC.1
MSDPDDSWLDFTRISRYVLGALAASCAVFKHKLSPKETNVFTSSNQLFSELCQSLGLSRPSAVAPVR